MVIDHKEVLTSLWFSMHLVCLGWLEFGLQSFRLVKSDPPPRKILDPRQPGPMAPENVEIPT